MVGLCWWSVWCVCVFAGAEGSLGEHLQDQRFAEWLKEHGELVARKNLDPAEIYPTWLENAKFVARHNARSLELGYEVSLNAFAYKKFSTEDVQMKVQNLFPPPPPPPPSPGSIDWRVKNVVPPVMNQGESGGAAIIAVVEGIESYIAIQKGTLYSLSMREVEDCCTDTHIAGSIYDCVVQMGGLAASSDYPQNSTHCVSQLHKPVATIEGGKSVARGNETALAEAVAKQPVVVAVDASRMSFLMYKSGVYSDDWCSRTRLDHAMLVIGYGTYQGINFWLCQNTWGSSWGMDGYIMIKRNAGNMCGIATEASYPF